MWIQVTSSPSSSAHPTFSDRLVHSFDSCTSLGAQVQQKSWNIALPRRGFEPLTPLLTIQYTKHYTVTRPMHCQYESIQYEIYRDGRGSGHICLHYGFRFVSILCSVCSSGECSLKWTTNTATVLPTRYSVDIGNAHAPVSRPLDYSGASRREMSETVFLQSTPCNRSL